METFNGTQSIGEIVAIMPKASEVFQKLKIDYCCGGHRLLSQVIKEQQLDEQDVLGKLTAVYEESSLYSNQSDFRTMSSSKIIDYIVSTHHAFLNQILPQLGELTTKILRAHSKNHSELFQVHKLFHNLRTELEQHLIKEEDRLFPMINKYEDDPSQSLLNEIAAVLKDIEDEHEAAGDIVKELRTITKEYFVPSDACPTYWNTYEKMKELEQDLFQHIHLENNILFRRLEII